MNNFGIFYTCYTEIEAVDHSIEVLKEIYPDCPVYLVSDGGSDYSFLESKYKNIKTKIGYDSRGISQNLTWEKWSNPEIRNKVLQSVNEFFIRNIEAINFCKKESMMIMEPDVLIRGKLNAFPNEKNALLGSKINHATYPEFNKMREILKSIPGSIDVTHFGATPAFYNTQAMIKVSEFVFKNQNIIKQFVDTDAGFVCYDVFLSILFGACGYEEVVNEDLTECIRNPSWENSNHPLLHQYREKYPKKHTGYSGRHANEIG